MYNLQYACMLSSTKDKYNINMQNVACARVCAITPSLFPPVVFFFSCLSELVSVFSVTDVKDVVYFVYP